MDYNSLQHWGIKGQKWGVRRYQNSDGTLTEAGKQRYDKELEGMKESKKKSHKANPDKWVTDDVSNAKNVVDATSKLNTELEKANTTLRRKPKEPDIDLSNMSDKEMRDAINRKLLERQYKDVVIPQNVSRGRETVENVLSATGSVLGITGAALGIAVSIRKLMGKG